jgi:putative transposase
MARLPRLVVPHQLHHVIQLGNDGQAFFRDDEDYAAFLRWLREASRQFKVAIHAYVLLPNQLDLLLTPSDAPGLGRLMQWVGRHYVPYFNRKYHRSGTLWQGRYKATVVDAEQYFSTCCRYIELMPVQLGIAGGPADYKWSSYAHHAGVRPDPVIIDHPLYWALGNTPFDREIAYKHLLEQALTIGEVDLVRDATLKGWALGSEAFKDRLAKNINRRVSPAKPGRPSKQSSPSSLR